MKKIKNFLIIFVSLLILSITPISAVQIGQKTTSGTISDGYTYDQLYNDIQNFFQEMEEAYNTELTEEQSKFLEDPILIERLQNKSTIMLYDLQNYLNYLLDEYNNYQTLNITNKRSVGDSSVEDTFKEDVDDMKEFLKNGELENIPINIDVETLYCNHTELNSYLKPGDNFKWDKSRVIVQIRDPDHYIRYMNLEDISDNYISLKSGDQPLEKSDADFNDLNVWNDRENSNTYHKFNIIIVPEGKRDTVLYKIWKKQDLDLDSKEAKINWGTALLTGAAALAATSLAGLGTYKLVDMCRRGDAQQAQQAGEMRGNIQQGGAEAAAAMVPQPQPQPAANTPLLKKDQAVTAYGAIVEGLDPKRKRIDICMFVLACFTAAGYIIAISCWVGLFFIMVIGLKNESNRANLAYYKPPLAK